MIMKYFLLLNAIIIFSFSAFSQEQLSLSSAVEKALNNAYGLKSANTNLAISERNNNWGEAGKMPLVSTSFQNSNTYSSIQNPTSFLNGADVLGSNSTFSADLQWTLFDGGRVKSSKKRLATVVEQNKADLQVIVDNVTLQVSKNYYNVLIQEKRLIMLAELLKLSRDKITYIEAKRAYGQAIEFDLLQVRDAYLNDSIQWVLQQTNYKNALQNLALSMGLEVSEDLSFSLGDSVRYDLKKYSFDELLEELKTNNRQLNAEKIKIKIAQVDIDLQKASLLPRILVGANVSEQLNVARIEGTQPIIPNNWRGGTTTSAGLNFSLNYTIYNGGKINRAIEVSELRKNISEFSAKDLERRLSQQLKIAFNLYENQKNVLNLSREMLSNSTRNLEIAEERFKAGTLNYFDFRTIQINYFRTVNTVQDAFINAKNTELDMLLQSGLLMKKD
jgi:outer membrane protein TolC